ncbi:uncharacterized protein LOC108117525 [Drosophila eugracilis]|uniref:uncharacterized protein LOC108117525 n=1 Tax=Drosophila eugracilis TaxID=29029 RepID=UPI001BD9F962|nr:uncharacterized protein LOC108117525 [Drosophila eugracilis]
MLQPSLLVALLLLLVHLENASGKPPTKELPRPLIPFHGHEEEDLYTELEAKATFQTIRNGRSRRPTLMDVALQQSVRQGLDAMAELYGRIQPEMLRNGQTLQDNHPAAMLSRFNAPTTDSERREMAAYATIAAAKAFRKNFQHIDELARQSHAQRISLRRTALEGLCPPRDPPPCMPASERYRTHDGTCNNKRRPRWGAAQMPFNRFLPPEYGDGVDTVRSSADGSTLSSSRFVSLLVHGAREGEAPLTLMIAQWGQMLDHDMTSTAQPRSINGSIPSCCGGKDFHPSCFPIKVPLDDPWLAPLKVRCLEFLRSAPAQRRDCVLSWREQTNQVTSYIDASPIYSNSAKSSDNARVFRHGLLVYGRGDPAEDVCQRGAIATKCIRSGDGRSGEQPGLLAMHHVWVGEHNRIALELSELNPHWSDEKVYQETRRIVGAMFQHITFREFLPVILGREVAKLFDLELMPSGYYERYSSKVNPTVANAFAAAAFRFGHSLVQNSYSRCDRHHNVINNNVSLHEEFQRGDIGSAGSLHRLLRGLASQRALKRDEFITPELTNHLFQTPGFPFGLDLAAINIQRGRDHGIAPYSAWRVPCGLSPILSWDDFANVVGPESAKRIGHAYRSVHDIDLFVGGIAERPVVGGLVGPTFACIIAQQFSNARRGDRFWYENGGFESSFTPAQLHSLRRVSLAQVLCRTVGGGTLQPHIFIPAEFEDNERQTCGTGSLSPIDLSPWLEQDPFHNQQVPDQVFTIGQPELGSVQVIKEDKAGFSNRVKPIKPHVEISSPSVSGFHRPTNGNSTKVSDKLDIRRKTVANKNTNNNRQTTPTRKPVSGVNNKLDKSPKITINIKSVNVRRPEGPKRRVIINNVPVELRSSGGNATDAETDTGTLTADENDDEFNEDEEMDMEDIEEVRANRDDPLTKTKTHPITTETDSKTGTVDKDEKDTSNKRIGLSTEDPKTERRDARNSEQQETTTEDGTADSQIFYLNRILKTTTEDHKTRQKNASEISELTKMTVERTQYQDRSIYETPQNVVVIGPNTDQEIGTNIGHAKQNQIVTKTETQTDKNERESCNERVRQPTEATKTDELDNRKSKDQQEARTLDETMNSRLLNIQTTTYGTTPTIMLERLTRQTKEPKIGPNTDQTQTETETETNSETTTANSNEATKAERRNTRKLETEQESLDTLLDSRLLLLERNATTRPKDYDTSSTVMMERFTQNTGPPKIGLNFDQDERETNYRQTKNNQTKTETETDLKTTTFSKTLTDTLIKPLVQSTESTETEKRDTRKLESQKESKTLDKTADPRLLHLQRNRTTTTKDYETSSTISLERFTRQTKAPKISKPTKRAVELRQYQNRPLYERPQKVVVNGPNADQYEIEINIRQTNKNPGSRPSTADYAEYTTVNKPYYDSNYAPHYVDYASTTPIPLPSYGYHQPLSEISTQGQRTKPPTIIYLNDNDDRRTTTRAPNIFQNFLTFATNTFNPLGNRRPMPTTPSPISQSHTDRPQFENNVVHSPISNSHILTGVSSSYSPRPQSVHSYPVATSSQISANPGSGFLHASSSAVSAGNFGSISGVATANGADSTFSFNIRPRPSPELGSVVSSYPRPAPNQGVVGGGGSYGILGQPSYRPDYAPPQSELYYDRELSTDRNTSPFSGSSSIYRPQLQAQTFYGRAPELKEVGNNSNELTQTEQKLYLQDYDYVSRTLSNLTTDESHLTEEDADYVYDEDFPSNDLDKTETRKETDVTELSTKKFDKDGYMRPQLMRNSTQNSTGTNVTSLDDNYVMPMLDNKTRASYVTEVPKPMLSTSSRSVTNSKVTVFPDSVGKQLGNDILADETDDYVDGNSEARLKAQRLKQLASVAFAPITVLTKPDRPDNWVIYNKASEEPPLPQPPAINMDVAPTGEVPTPIKNFNNGWLKQDLKVQPEGSITKSEDVPIRSDPTEMARKKTTVAAADSN